MRRAALLLVVLAGCPKPGPHAPPGGGAGSATSSWPDPPAANGSLGVDGPVAVSRVARDGRWAVLCQARTDDSGDGVVDDSWDMHGNPYGDTMSPAIVVRSGAGVPFDDLLAVSADERWVAVHRGATYALVDTVAPSIVDLGPGPQAEGAFLGWATFSGDGTALARIDGAGVVLRSLATGEERHLDLGGPVWRLDGDAAGRWIRAEVLTRDTDGDGTVTRVWGLASDGLPPCAGPWTDDGDFGAMGDEPEIVWIDAATGDLLRDPDLIRPVAEHQLKRAGTAVALDGAALGGAACATAQVAAVLPDPISVLLECGGEPPRFHVVGPAGDAAVTASIRSFDDPPVPPPLVDGPACADGYCVDLTRAAAVSPDGEFISRSGRSAFYAEGEQLVAVDLVTGTARPVTEIFEWGNRLEVGTVLVIDGKAIDATTAQVLNEGPAPRVVVGGDAAGRLLIAASAEEHRFARGPLRWQDRPNTDPR